MVESSSEKPLRLKCLGCEALARIIYFCAAHSSHIVDVTLCEIGLHNRPGELRSYLQQEIDQVDAEKYDAVVLVYGLCGQATLGLRATRLPVVIPKAHDCITLFLGDRARYRQVFDEEPGTYWYTNDYIERKAGTTVALGTGIETNLDEVYEEYVEKYGKDNADYLMEVMGAWQAHYRRAVFIDTGLGDGADVERRAQEQAARRGWAYQKMEGDLVLIRRLLNGDWDADFVVLRPGQETTMTYNDEVIGCQVFERRSDGP